MKHMILAASLTVCLYPAPVTAQTARAPEIEQQSGNYPYQARRYGQSSPAQYPQVPQGEVAPELTLPAGTLISVRAGDYVSSDRNLPGDGFAAILEQPLVAQGWVVARRGQTVAGRVAYAQKAGRVQGVSGLAVELSELILVDGQQVPIRTRLIQISAGPSRDRDVGAIAATTSVGALVGAAAGGGTGAAIGAAAGAATGVAGVLSTRGLPTEIHPETVLTFRLEEPVTISTQRSRQAFLPVTQDDYAGRESYRTRRYYPGPPSYAAPYYYPAPYPYGYYGSFGYGRGYVYSGPKFKRGRGHYKHRHH